MEIRKLNTLRGIAAILVLVSHYSNKTMVFNGYLGKGGGQIGVMLFFILSGFLMSYLYLQKGIDKKNISNYIIARLARVVPLFFIVVLGSYFLNKYNVLGNLYNISSIENLISHLLFLSGSNILHTIPTEIHFYFIFIFLWWLWSKNKYQLFTVMSVIFILVILLKSPVLKGSIYGIYYELRVFRSLPYFFIGLIFGQLYTKWKAPKEAVGRKYLFSFILLFLIYPNIYKHLIGGGIHLWSNVGVFYIVSLVFFCFVFLVADDDKLIVNRIGDFLGKISYSTYLLHVPILKLVHSYSINSPYLFFPAYIILVLATAYLSYLLIEKPSRNFIRARFIKST